MTASRTRGSTAAASSSDKLKPEHSSRELERVIRKDEASQSQNATPLQLQAHAGECALSANPEETSVSQMKTPPEGSRPPATHLSLEPLLTS